MLQTLNNALNTIMTKYLSKCADFIFVFVLCRCVGLEVYLFILVLSSNPLPGTLLNVKEKTTALVIRELKRHINEMPMKCATSLSHVTRSGY